MPYTGLFNRKLAQTKDEQLGIVMECSHMFKLRLCKRRVCLLTTQSEPHWRRSAHLWQLHCARQPARDGACQPRHLYGGCPHLPGAAALLPQSLPKHQQQLRYRRWCCQPHFVRLHLAPVPYTAWPAPMPSLRGWAVGAATASPPRSCRPRRATCTRGLCCHAANNDDVRLQGAASLEPGVSACVTLHGADVASA